MNANHRDIEALVRGLRSLRDIEAPPHLLPAVAVETGVGDAYFPIETPIGRVFVAYNARGISAVMRAEDAPAFEEAFRAQFKRSAYPAPEPPASLLRGVIEHLEGRRRDLRFDLRGLSEFQQAVLRKALEIPRGETRPYAWIAHEIGRPRAVRAVGSALANNPIPLLIPCHRVVRSDGVIWNYGLGGPANKRALLEAEGANLAELENLARQGFRYVGSETTKVYCFPTCRHARRITARHRHPLRSEEEAAVAGFRPCRVCRPGGLAVGA